LGVSRALLFSGMERYPRTIQADRDRYCLECNPPVIVDGYSYRNFRWGRQAAVREYALSHTRLCGETSLADI